MHNQFQIQHFLDETLKKLSTYKLHPVPDNYRLWYEYSCASVQELNDEIDELVEQQIAINEKICRKLYQKYLASGDQKDFDATRLALSHFLNIMIEQISIWDNTSGEFCKTLEQCTQKLSNDPSITELNAIISTLIAETESISLSTSNINQALKSLNSEVIKLRKELAKTGSEAITDSLTGISNRRGMDEKLANAIKTANKDRSELSIIVVDIDHFKLINDNFGHTVGDKVLKYIASVMQRNLRATDFIARFGGEEFVIILPETNQAGAIQVAEHIRHAVSSKKLTVGNKDQSIGKITVSLGVAQHKFLEEQDALIERADHCMYAAKHAGRNRVKSEARVDMACP